MPRTTKAREKDPFAWGYRMVAKIHAKAGDDPVDLFLKKLEGKWLRSKSVDEKKAYFGARKAFAEIKEKQEMDSGTDIGVFGGVVLTKKTEKLLIELANIISKNAMESDLGIQVRAANSIISSRPIMSAAHLEKLHYVGEKTISAILNEAISRNNKAADTALNQAKKRKEALKRKREIARNRRVEADRKAEALKLHRAELKAERQRRADERRGKRIAANAKKKAAAEEARALRFSAREASSKAPLIAKRPCQAELLSIAEVSDDKIPSYSKEMNSARAFELGKALMQKELDNNKIKVAKKTLRELRLKWTKSKTTADKKVYDGAKIVLQRAELDCNLKNQDEIFYGVVSPSLWETFGESFLKKYNLINLNSVLDTSKPHNVPCVYFGCYKSKDVRILSNNKSKFKIVVYGGTDATRRRNLKNLQRRNGRALRHVSISRYISKDLANLRIPYKEIGITPVDHSSYGIKPVPLGNSVYIYNCSEAKKEQYGSALYEEVIRRFAKSDKNIKFEVCAYDSFSREELLRVYKRSFIGLRLIDHDGLPNTVIELGLMGRRTVHNGGLPSGISYNNIEDICKAIEKEYSKVGAVNKDVAEDTQKHLENSRAWLKKDYWER
jgi:hypothetical protein